MRLTTRIAWRYIFSKKTTNAINIISGISMSGIVIGTAALIIVLSAFNGFEELVLKLYSSFYPDIYISAKEGKVFIPDSAKLAQIRGLEGVAYISETLEENGLLAYNKQEHIATVKGVDTMYRLVNAVDDSVFLGEYQLEYNQLNYNIDCAVVGSGVAATLSIGLGIENPPIQIFMPRRGNRPAFDPRNTFIEKSIQPMGIFHIQQDFDDKYIITSLPFLQNMLEYTHGEIGALEIKTTKSSKVNALLPQIQNIMGDGFDVKNRYMQNAFLYKVMRSEKWAVYLILTFIFIIAAFNMIGSISMLVIDKKKDIGILRSLGAREYTIRNIFFIQGVLQTIVSITIGFLIAATLCYLQLRFGLIKIPGQGTFVVSSYPVAMKWKDFVSVFLTILFVGSAVSYFPAFMAARQKWLFKSE